jgi:CRISPR/Cas system endoribonuclease Cas6 (RAMP superfamily)
VDQLEAEPIALRTGTGSVAVYPGWKGRITFTCRKSQIAYMSTLWTLARLACFTGVGDYTEVGLGVTQIMEND